MVSTELNRGTDKLLMMFGIANLRMDRFTVSFLFLGPLYLQIKIDDESKKLMVK